MPNEKKFPGMLGFPVEAREIEGKLCIGMEGNLDTLHDALLWLNQHDADGTEKKRIAELIVRALNANWQELAPFLLKQSPNWFSPMPGNFKKGDVVQTTSVLDLRETGGPLIMKGSLFMVERVRRTGELWVHDADGVGHRHLLPANVELVFRTKN